MRCAAILVEVAIALKSRSNHVIDEHKQQERRKDYESIPRQEESLAASQSMANQLERFSMFTQSDVLNIWLKNAFLLPTHYTDFVVP